MTTKLLTGLGVLDESLLRFLVSHVVIVVCWHTTSADVHSTPRVNQNVDCADVSLGNSRPQARRELVKRLR